MKTKTIPWILSVILLLVIIGQHIFYTNKTPKTITVTDSIMMKPDSIPYSVVVPAPYPVFKDTGSAWIQILKTEVDTFTIIRDWQISHMSKNVYKRTLKDDSSALVRLTDTVYDNKLHQSKFTFQNRRAEQISHNIYIDRYPSRLYLGGQTSFSNNHPERKLNEKLGFGFVGTYTVNRMAFGGSYDIINNASTFSIQYSFK